MSETARTVEMRITDYLCGGGLFNPELANHDAVRDLLIDARDALAAERERAERLMERLQQESERCDKEVSQRIWADTELQRERERADRNQEDAERYRWLQSEAKQVYMHPNAEIDNRMRWEFPVLIALTCINSEVSLNAAIDAARRK